MFFEATWNEPDETFDIIVKSGFKRPVLPDQIVHIMELILGAIQSNVGQRLFEGLPKITINETGLELTFRFSGNAEQIAQVESQIGRQELHSHRVNFIFFVFAKVDTIYPLDDSLPTGFRENLNMPSYIR